MSAQDLRLYKQLETDLDTSINQCKWWGRGWLVVYVLFRLALILLPAITTIAALEALSEPGARRMAYSRYLDEFWNLWREYLQLDKTNPAAIGSFNSKLKRTEDGLRKALPKAAQSGRSLKQSDGSSRKTKSVPGAPNCDPKDQV
jgi:hypothetical protein